MQHLLSRFEVALAVGALALIVVGVSLIAIPGEPAGTVTRVAGAQTTRTAVRAAAPARPAAVAPAAPPSASIAPVVPFTIEGPAEAGPWQTARFTVSALHGGDRSIAIWWTGAAMGNWTWQRLQGHCELSPSQDRLAGAAQGPLVIELDLTPSGAPGGALQIYASEAGGPALRLTTVQIPNA